MNAEKWKGVLKRKLKRQAAFLMAAALLFQANVVYASPDKFADGSGKSEADTIQTLSENQLSAEGTALSEPASEENQEAISEEDLEKENAETIEGGSISANLAGEGELIEADSPFEEDRYNPIYYGEVVDRWPVRETGTSLYMTAEQEKTFEAYILNAVSNYEMIVDVSAYAIPVDDMWTEIYHVFNNHPELYYVTPTSAYYSPTTMTVASYIFTYIGTEDTIETEKAKFQAEAKKACKYVDDSMSDYEKALAVHDYIVLNCEYDEENYNTGASLSETHTAYGALVNKIAVCDGYAKAYQYILTQELGINCQVVSSSEMGHAWSMVLINGRWYHADLTWDDPVYDCIGRVSHDYFLLSDAVISDYEHEHYGWQVKDKNKQDITATSNTYADYDWVYVTSGMFKSGSYWYYTVKIDGITYLVKDTNLAYTGNEELFPINNEGNSAWINPNNGCLSRVMLYNDRLYFTTPSEIKSCDLNMENEKTEYKPEKASNQFIYGFVIQNGNMKYALMINTGAAERQEVRTIGVGSATILSLAAKDYNSLDITLQKVGKADNATASGYVIYKKASWEKQWSTAAVLEGADNTYFRDANLLDNTSYSYKARNYQVINGDRCYGAFGNEMTAVTMKAAPPAPVTPPAQEETKKQDKAVVGKTYKVGNYKYKVTAAGKVTLTAPVKKTYSKVTIPATVKIKNESYKVTAVAKNAFKNNKKLKSITIGKNVVTIGSNAFYGCAKLETITIKTTKLKTVGKNSFKKIAKKAVIKVPKSKLNSYKKLLKKKATGLSSKVKIKKS